MIKCILSFVLLSILVGCSERTPTGIIPKEKMMTVLWDYMEANVYSFEHRKDSLNNDTLVNAKMQNAIFKKYRITRQEFANSFDFYSKNAIQFKVMIDSILVRKQRIDTSSIAKENIVPIVPIIDSVGKIEKRKIRMNDSVGKIKRGLLPAEAL